METMKKTLLSLLLAALTFVLSIFHVTSAESTFEKFYGCIPNTYSQAIYTPNNSSSFSQILNMHIRNKRFQTTTTPKPLAVIVANQESIVQETIKCAKIYNIQIRIRSGGHDYEGLSYVSDVPYVILDMFGLNSIEVDIYSETAWVQTGATLGKLYYDIANKSQVHGFPGGVCHTVGTGGHFSGGGYGNLMRKYGLSVDNIIDAKMVDVNGNILDRKSMGEDLFWAIRGGGGASFGVILAWKIKLVSVTPQVTVFTVKKRVEEDATDVIYQWQFVAPKLHKDLFIRAKPTVVNSTATGKGKRTVEVSFIGLFLGTTDRLLPLMNMSFPELGLQKSDCIQMPWVNSTLYWELFPLGTPLETLLDTKGAPTFYYKSKSDYVKKPIPKEAIKSMWERMVRVENMYMEWNPYGGRMEEISASATPFPHRAGNLFKIQYYTKWFEDGVAAYNYHINFSRSFYEFMTPYVSASPREAFLNYRDIDIGANHPSNVTKFDIAKLYGSKFFKDNFGRLVDVKSRVDPQNFFRYEQSIPPRSSKIEM